MLSKPESTYEISIKNGFGPIQFGASPSEVKSAWGSDIYYEDWMGGNLESFLYFKGLLVGFRGEIEEHPTEEPYVCMFQVKTVHPVSIWEHEITTASRSDIEFLLDEQKNKFVVLPNGIIRCVEQELQFHFSEVGLLDEVYFAK